MSGTPEKTAKLADGKRTKTASSSVNPVGDWNRPERDRVGVSGETSLLSGVGLRRRLAYWPRKKRSDCDAAPAIRCQRSFAAHRPANKPDKVWLSQPLHAGLRFDEKALAAMRGTNGRCSSRR